MRYSVFSVFAKLYKTTLRNIVLYFFIVVECLCPIIWMVFALG